MEQEELNLILKNHEKWLTGKGGGEKADLSNANLSNADLRSVNLSNANLIGADLYGADLSGANLYGADLYGADLSNAKLIDANLYGAKLIDANLSNAKLIDANLSNAKLSGANLYGADLSGANLSNADLSGADLSNADLSGADLSGANLICADLTRANLSDANLSGVKYNHTTSFYALQCPEKGSFTAYKKCGSKVVELFIPKSAKRSSATSRKCRADKAKVIAIYNLDKTVSDLKNIASNYDESFIYEIGKTVIVKDFDDNRWNECSSGIHFFITFDEAKQY